MGKLKPVAVREGQHGRSDGGHQERELVAVAERHGWTVVEVCSRTRA
jgi:hypothetical protein